MLFTANSQTIPANMNLVADGSFEHFGAKIMEVFGTGALQDTVCWTGATPYGPRLSGSYYDTLATISPCNRYDVKSRTGKYHLVFDQFGPKWSRSQNRFIDTTTQVALPVIFPMAFPETRLLKPLVAGTTYYLTFYLGTNKSDSCDNCCYYRGILKNFGVRFDVAKLFDANQTGYHFPNNLPAQINFLNWIPSQSSGFGYTKFTVAYTAQGGEQYMTLGTFSWLKDWQITDINRCYYPGDIAGDVADSFGLSRALDDVSLVEDTTIPMIDLSFFSLGNDTFLCPGASMTLGGEPYFFHYLWDNGDTSRFRTINTPGTYWCTVDYGCNTYTDTIHVLPPPILPQNLFNDTTVCFPDTVLLSLPQHYPVQLWSTSDTSQQIAITGPGTYSVLIGNGCGLFFRDTVIIRAKATALPTVSIPNAWLCDFTGGSLQFRAPNFPGSYLWSTGDTVSAITISQPGQYWVRLTNACGATAGDTFSVFAQPPAFSLGADTVLCGDGASFTLSVPLSYPNVRWSNGDTAHTLLVNTAGVYSVTAFSPCDTVRDTIVVRLCAPVIDALSLSKDTLCEGDCTAPLVAVRNRVDSWEWTFPGGQPTTFFGPRPPIVCYPDSGVFPVRLVVRNVSDSDTLTTWVNVYPQPIPRFGDTALSAAYGTMLSLPACAEGLHINWYDEAGNLVCADCPTLPLKAEIFKSRYLCIIRNTEECADSCTYNLRVTNIPTDIHLPNAFTPNGDGLNDRFAIIPNNPNVRVEDFRIFNRVGEEVFREGGLGAGWDGNFKGAPVEMGVYYWFVTYKVVGYSNVFMLKGDVSVVR